MNNTISKGKKFSDFRMHILANDPIGAELPEKFQKVIKMYLFDAFMEGHLSGEKIAEQDSDILKNILQFSEGKGVPNSNPKLYSADAAFGYNKCLKDIKEFIVQQSNDEPAPQKDLTITNTELIEITITIKEGNYRHRALIELLNDHDYTFKTQRQENNRARPVNPLNKKP